MKKAMCILIVLLAVILICSCQNKESNLQDKEAVNESLSVKSEENKDEKEAKSENKVKLNKFANIPRENEFKNNLVFEEGEYEKGDIITYSFDNTTIFKGNEDLANNILEAGKNPGLGVRELHNQGITGKGVNIGIIDQNMLLDHPEIKDKVVAYFDTGCEQPEDNGSYHGVSVTSILVGETVGVAPGAKIYYAAAPSWKKDAKFYADGLNWIIEQNNNLPEDEKIKVVSVSAAPEGNGDWYVNGEDWSNAVEKAHSDGIMVIDCRSIDDETGFIFSAYYDSEDPENVEKCRPGYLENDSRNYKDDYWKGKLFAPASLRTLAQEYKTGEYNYRYDSQGGQSWSVPYVSGVLALGWQIRPELDYKTMKELLFSSAYITKDGNYIINPPKFIEAVKNVK